MVYAKSVSRFCHICQRPPGRHLCQFYKAQNSIIATAPAQAEPSSPEALPPFCAAPVKGTIVPVADVFPPEGAVVGVATAYTEVFARKAKPGIATPQTPRAYAFVTITAA